MGTYGKIALACALLATAYAVTLPEADGYELSIYAAFPAPFWALVVGGLAAGLYDVARSPRVGRTGIPVGYWAILGLWLVVFLLPVFRGYPWLGRHDPLTHIGMTRDILQIGHPGDSNFYPSLHIFIASLTLWTDAPILSAAKPVMPLLSVAFLLSTVALLRAIFPGRGHLGAILLAATVPMMGRIHVTLAPSAISFYLVPLILFAGYRSIEDRRASYSILLIGLLLAITVFHSGETSPFLTIILFTTWAVLRLPRTGTDPRRVSVLFFAGLITAVSSFRWFSEFPVFERNLGRLADSLLGLDESSASLPTYIDKVREQGARAGLTFNDLAEIVLRQYGDEIIFGLLALAGVALLVRRRRQTTWWRVLPILALFTVTALSIPVFLFRDLIIHLRPLKYLVLYTMVLAVPALAWWLGGRPRPAGRSNQERKRRIGPVLLVVPLLAAATVAVFDTYPNPKILAYNQQVTAAEIAGAEWFFNAKNDELLVDEVFYLQDRFASYVLGEAQASERHDVRSHRAQPYPPDHFGYNETATLGEHYSEARYVIVNPVVRVVYRDLWPDVARFTEAEYERLEVDPTVNRLYDSNDFNIYLVRPVEDGSSPGAGSAS